MTVIRPNSVSGITSITAQANEINFFRSNGTLAGLQLNGVNFNTTTGVSTFNNLDVGGVLTYQDVTNVDSVGIITARSNIDCNGDLDVDGHTNLDNVSIAGVTTFASTARFSGGDVIFSGTNNFVQWDKSADYLRFMDGVDATFGNSDDLKIYHSSGGASNIVHSNTSQPLKISATGAGNIAFETNSNERLRIGSDGAILVSNSTGIGIGAATNGSSSYPSVTISGTSGGAIHFEDDGDLLADIYGSSSGLTFTTRKVTDAIVFQTNSGLVTEKIRIKSDGTVVFNNTINTIHTSSNDSKLVLFGGSNNSVSNGGVLSLHGITNSSGNYTDLSAGAGGYIQFRSGTSEKFRITAGGEVLCGVTSTGTDPTRNITLHAGSMMRVSNFYMGRVHGSGNNGNAAIVLHRLGQNQGFQMSGSMTFHSYTGSAYLSGSIVARYNNDSVSRDVSLQKADSGMNLQLVTGTISGVSGSYLAIKKNGGGTGVCYINGHFAGNIESHGGIREVSNANWTTTTIHGTGITGGNDSLSS